MISKKTHLLRYSTACHQRTSAISSASLIKPHDSFQRNTGQRTRRDQLLKLTQTRQFRTPLRHRLQWSKPPINPLYCAGGHPSDQLPCKPQLTVKVIQRLPVHLDDQVVEIDEHFVEHAG
jgi:hypothetical protein